MKLSIVATLYQSSMYIVEFCQRASLSAQQLVGNDYEIVLVNDGSPDNSLEIATKLHYADSHIIIVDLSRNFGHHKAMMTGLAHSHGEQVFLIDVDLEEDPEWLIEFSQQMEKDYCDVVYGVQKKRKGGMLERISGQWFYRFFRVFTGVSIPENMVTSRLMSRRYVDALVSHNEREVFLAGLWHITGFEQHPHTITKHSTSESTYTIRRKLSLLVNSITSFSNTPLILIFYIGLTILIFSGAYSLYMVLNWFFAAKPPSGWTSVITSIWFLGGLIISFIGIIGVYISKIFSETKHRPYTIVRHIYERKD